MGRLEVTKTTLEVGRLEVTKTTLEVGRLEVTKTTLEAVSKSSFLRSFNFQHSKNFAKYVCLYLYM